MELAEAREVERRRSGKGYAVVVDVEVEGSGVNREAASKVPAWGGLAEGSTSSSIPPLIPRLILCVRLFLRSIPAPRAIL